MEPDWAGGRRVGKERGGGRQGNHHAVRGRRVEKNADETFVFFTLSLSLLLVTNNRLAIVVRVFESVVTARQPALDSFDRRTSRKNEGDG